jgi:transposase
VLRREDKRRGLSCFCALTNTGKLYTIYFKGSINGERIVTALRHLRRYQKGPVILIWDSLTAHTSKVVKEHLANDTLIDVEVLPSYSPELNPEEYCHGYAKKRMRNATPLNEQELLQCAEREFNRIRRRPKLMQSFFAHAKLSIINQSS